MRIQDLNSKEEVLKRDTVREISVTNLDQQAAN